jgi:hypothetical protein
MPKKVAFLAPTDTSFPLNQEKTMDAHIPNRQTTKTSGPFENKNMGHNLNWGIHLRKRDVILAFFPKINFNWSYGSYF